MGRAVRSEEEARVPRRRRREERAGLALVGLLLLGTSLPFALQDPHASKATYREAGSLLAAEGVTRVLAHDGRAGFYAGAERLDLIVLLAREAAATPEAGANQAQTIARLARREAAQAVVLPVGREHELQTSAALAELLGREPVRLRPQTSVALDIHFVDAGP